MQVIGAICLGIGCVLLIILMKCGGVTEEGYMRRERKYIVLHIISGVFQLIGSILMFISIYR